MSQAIIDQSHLLSNLEDILDSDPQIDEVGFVHPTQFAAFNEDVHISYSSSAHLGDEITKPNPIRASTEAFFWHNEHKLGISTVVLVPLYRAAKDAFMDAYNQYTKLSDSHVKKDEISSLDVLGNEVMKHSRALLLLSCDFGTAWNSRKLILSRKPLFQMFMDELHLSALVLSYSPKSERAWSHRRWVIKMITRNCSNLQEIVERESQLVKTLAENSKMNYRAWNHRSWLVNYMSHSQVVLELQSSRDWAALHVADNSCFHYRARLLLQMIESLRRNSDGLSGGEIHRTLKEELDWVGMLIKRYVGRESLWLHRRFLSVIWMEHLPNDGQSMYCRYCCANSKICDATMFVKHELMLFHSCTIIPDNEFGDYEAQATFSATYIMRLAKQFPTTFGAECRASSQYEALKSLLDNAGKIRIWDAVTESCEGT